MLPMELNMKLAKPDCVKNAPPMAKITVTRNATIFNPIKSKDYSIRKDLLCNYSAFFENAFQEQRSKRTRNSREQSTIVDHLEIDLNELIDLDVVHLECFDMFIHWISNQNIQRPKGLVHGGVVWNHLELWLLAERLEIPRLQNHAVERLFRLIYNYDGLKGILDYSDDIGDDYLEAEEFFRIAWSSGKNGPLARLVLDFLGYVTLGEFEMYAPSVPAAMVLEVTRRLKRNNDKFPPEHFGGLISDDYYIDED